MATDPSERTAYLATSSVDDLRRRLADGSLTAQRLVSDCLDRIDDVDRAGPGLRAAVATDPAARDVAAELDRERAAGHLRGPLHGIPVVVKDNLDTVDGLPTTAGSLALTGSRPAREATVVERLRAAGAVVVAKANLSEWANWRGNRSTSGWSAVGGLTLNPHALDRTAGGSSSGSGAAVAAGLAPLAVGTETDGSIICPAAACGVVGVKPTVGLTSRAGVVPISSSQDTVGPMTRSVRDAALLLTAMAGPDPRDGATAAAPAGVDYAAGLTERLDGLRVGVPRGYYWGRHAGVDAVVERSLSVLSSLGAEVVDGTDVETAKDLHDAPDELTVMLYEFHAGIDDYLRGRVGDGPRDLAELVAFNRAHAAEELCWFGQERFEAALDKPSLDDPAYRAALATGRRRARDDGIDATLARHRVDALVVPALDPAWKADLVLGDPDVRGCTQAPAVAGYPVVTVPAGVVHELPVGVAFLGTAWSEPVLLRLAHAYEQASREVRVPAYREPVAGR